MTPFSEWFTSDEDLDYGAICGIREEDKRIYIYQYDALPNMFETNFDYVVDPIPADTEVVLYDFNLSLGDTVYWDNYYSPRIITAEDSILLADGYYHRQLHFDSNDETEQIWIEGIGSTLGLLAAYVPASAIYGFITYYLECVKENDIYLFGTTDCDIATVNSIDNLVEQNIVIYPNPASDYFTISSKGVNSDAILELEDCSGRVIYHSQILNLETVIDIKNLPAGIYVVVIKSGGQIISRDILTKPN